MPSELNLFILIGIGFFIGTVGSFSGLGGGFVAVPLLLFLGYSAQKAVGTSFVVILIISASALYAHNRFDNIDFKTGLLVGVGGVIGAQVGAQLVQYVPTDIFRKVFALFLAGISAYLFLKK
jgi:uncharacterized membrane protein YfcA